MFVPMNKILAGCKSNSHLLVIAFTANSSVVEIIHTINFGYSWVFTSHSVLIVLRGRNKRFFKSFKMHAVNTFRITHRGDIGTFLVRMDVIGCTVYHLKESIFMNYSRIEDRSFLPIMT